MAAPSSPFPFFDFSKFYQNFNFAELYGPMYSAGTDARALFETQQKNFEALARAQRILMEASQTLFQRQTEIMQAAMQEATKAAQDLMTDTDPQSNAGKRFEAARTSFERGLGNMTEVSDMATKASTEAMEIIRNRALEAFEEIRAAVEKSTGPKPGTRGGARKS